MDEYIKRADAIEWIRHEGTAKSPTTFILGLAVAIEKITALPAADVWPVVRGQWEWRGFNIKCPFCEFEPVFDSTEPLYNFCPNCGADMRKADNAKS